MKTINPQAGSSGKRRRKVLAISLITLLLLALLSQTSLTNSLAYQVSDTPTMTSTATETPTTTSTVTQTPTGTSPASPTVAPVSLSFQNGVSPSATYNGMVDTFISQANPDGNRGFFTPITVNGPSSATATDANYALLKWDISQIPVGSVILSAQLTFSVITPTVDLYPIYELLQPWVFDQATWNLYAAGLAWQAPGAGGAADHGSQVLGSFSPPTAGTYTTNLNRAVVQAWVDRTSPNNGIIFSDAGGRAPTIFESAESTTPANRPKLTIQYNLPPGTTPTPTVTIEPTIPAPAAPTQLTAIAASSTQINLTWVDNSINESGFQVERSTDQTNWALVTTTAANVTSFQNTGLTINTIYYFRVRAVNSTGFSAYSNIASATTPGTPTPTVSGTPPTPTVTGTITPNMAIEKSVSPSQARVGQLFNFTIEIANSGTAPALTAFISDTFPTVLTITGASTNKGTYTINTTSNTITFTLGTINPGDSVKVVVLTQVNNTATANANYSNAATLTFVVNSVTQSRTSNSVAYRIIGSGTLPPTGYLDSDSSSTTSGILIVALLIAGLLAVAGIGLFAYSFRAKQNSSPWATWLSRTGLICIAAALVFGLISWGLNLPTQSVEQASAPTDTAVSVVIKPEFSEAPLGFVFPTPTPERLPDFPIPSPTLAAGQAEHETDTSPVEHILIPAIGLDTVVKFVPFDGFTWQIAGLKQEIAWMGDTSWPGLGKNTGLAGHVTLVDGTNGPFRYLADLRSGDAVTVYTQENIYTYKVREQLVVDDTEMDILKPTDNAQLTLITCANWDKDLKIYLDRLIVYADLEKVEPITTARR